MCGWGDRSGTRASPLLPRPFLSVHAQYVARVPPSAPLRPQATGADGWIRRRRCRARCHHLPLSRSVRRRYVRLQNGCTLPCVQPSSYGIAAPLHAVLQVVRLVTAYPEIVDLRLPDPAVLPTAKSWTDGSALSSPDRPFTLTLTLTLLLILTSAPTQNPSPSRCPKPNRLPSPKSLPSPRPHL